jgi:hypothetical protein
MANLASELAALRTAAVSELAALPKNIVVKDDLAYSALEAEQLGKSRFAAQFGRGGFTANVRLGAGLMALLICSVGCGSNSVRKDGAAFELATLFPGYTYTAWLNNEPTSWGYAQSTPVLYGFPLQTGSNHITVKIEILPPPEEPPRIIRLEALVRDTEKDPTEKVDWTEVDDFDRSRPFTETSYVWESEFELKSQVGQTFKDFDPIGSNKESVTRRARLLAIAFASKLRDGNKTEWGRIWGPGGELQFGLSMAPFAGTNQFSAKSVSESSELVVETGSYLILEPVINFCERGIGA